MNYKKNNFIKKRAIISIICCLLFINCLGIGTSQFSAILKDYKQVRILKGNAGELLGYIYVKENKQYTTGVLLALLVVKKNGAKLDTLYQINSDGLFNSKGKMELKYSKRGYYGFKLGKELKTTIDLFSIGFVDNKGNLYADDNDFLIDWNYKNKIFGYDPAP